MDSVVTWTRTGFQNVSPCQYYPHGNDIAGKIFYEGKVSKPKKKDSTSFTCTYSTGFHNI